MIKDTGLETKPKIVKIIRMKHLLSCTFCPPHQHENARGSSHKSKIRMRGWKDKLKRKKQFSPSKSG